LGHADDATPAWTTFLKSYAARVDAAFDESTAAAVGGHRATSQTADSTLLPARAIHIEARTRAASAGLGIAGSRLDTGGRQAPYGMPIADGAKRAAVD
jgi:hypothetical protein